MRYERQTSGERSGTTEKNPFRTKEIISMQHFHGRSVRDILRNIEGVTEIGSPTRVSFMNIKNKSGGISCSYDRMLHARPQLVHKRINDDSTYRILEARNGKKILQTDAFGDAVALKNKITAGEYHLSGEQYLRQQNWSKAIHSFDVAMMYDVEYVQPFFDKAYCQYKMGTVLEEILDRVPTFGNLFSDLQDVQKYHFMIDIYANKEVSPAAGILRDVHRGEIKRRDEVAYFFRKLFVGIEQKIKDEQQKKERGGAQSEKDLVDIVRDITSKISFDGKSVEDVLQGTDESVKVGVPTHLSSNTKLLSISKIQEVTYVAPERIKKARPDLMHKKSYDGSVYKIVELRDGTIALITDMWGDVADLENKIKAEEYYSFGDHAARKGLWDQAIEHFDVAIDLDSEYAKPFLGRAYCRWTTAAYDAAIDDILAYNTLFRGSYRSYKLLGRCYVALGEYGKAMTHLETALKNLDNWTIPTKEQEKEELHNIIESIRKKQAEQQFEISLHDFQQVGNEQSLGTIKKMYHDLALRYHPDKVRDRTDEDALQTAIERIQKINDVYDTITAKK